MSSTHMKLLHPRLKSTFLDILCPLIDVNDYPIFTHAVVVLVSASASWNWQRDQYNLGWIVIVEVVRSRDNHPWKTYHEQLETHILSTRKGYRCRKNILRRGLLAATQKFANQWQKALTRTLFLLQIQSVIQWDYIKKYLYSWGGKCRYLRQQWMTSQ